MDGPATPGGPDRARLRRRRRIFLVVYASACLLAVAFVVGRGPLRRLQERFFGCEDRPPPAQYLETHPDAILGCFHPLGTLIDIQTVESGSDWALGRIRWRSGILGVRSTSDVRIHLPCRGPVEVKLEDDGPLIPAFRKTCSL